MKDIAIQFDFDGIIKPGKTSPELMGWDYLSFLNSPEKQILGAKGLYLTIQKKLYEKFIPEKAEEVSLRSYSNIFLKKYKPPLRFVEDKVLHYSNSIPDYIIDGIISIKHDKFINSTDILIPIQLMLDEVGLKTEFVEIYANDFLINNKRVIGIKEPLYVGRLSKAEKTLELKQEYETVISIGEGYSDLGMFEHSDEAYTIKDAHPKTKKHVSDIFGESHVLPSIKELFEVLQNI